MVLESPQTSLRYRIVILNKFLQFLVILKKNPIYVPLQICFWLIENNLQVLIAACDTFRAGAVEQLRTHTRHLNALHPPERHNGRQMVNLYEKGYGKSRYYCIGTSLNINSIFINYFYFFISGKDAAGIALEAINYAREARIDVVLVDTAGRMQDNGPLMIALAKVNLHRNALRILYLYNTF